MWTSDERTPGERSKSGEDLGVLGPPAPSSRDLLSGAKTTEVWGLAEEEGLGPFHV